MNFKTLGLAAVAATSLLAAQASATVILANDIASGFSNGITFTADDGMGGGAFETKTIAGVTGVGVAGITAGEIDIGQSITASYEDIGFRLSSFTLAFLYDGPEFGDVQEKAKFTATFLDGSTTSYAILTNLYTAEENTDFYLSIDGGPDVSASYVLSADYATNTTAARVTIGNLFGNDLLSSLKFEAIPGVCAVGACNNDSDYSIERLVVKVPEPGTLALLGLGVAGLWAGRRRTKSAA